MTVPSPRKVGPTREDYRWQVGEDALERQKEEARIRFGCCGELKDGGHHAMCRKREELEVHPGQATLA